VLFLTCRESKSLVLLISWVCAVIIFGLVRWASMLYVEAWRLMLGVGLDW